MQSVGGEGNDSGSYPSSPNYALPIGISAAVATIILFCFLYFILRRKRIAANLAAKERYEAMMAITVQPITPRTAPPLTLSMETLTRPMDLRFNV